MTQRLHSAHPNLSWKRILVSPKIRVTLSQTVHSGAYSIFLLLSPRWIVTSVVNLVASSVDDRHEFITVSVHRCSRHDGSRAGSSAAAETC